MFIIKYINRFKKDLRKCQKRNVVGVGEKTSQK